MGSNAQNTAYWYVMPEHWHTMMVDAHLEAATGVAAVAVPTSQRLHLDKCRTFVQFKNMCTTRCDVTVYRMRLHRDRPKAADDIFGPNPPWITAADDAGNQLIPVTQIAATTSGLPALVAAYRQTLLTHNSEPADFPAIKTLCSVKKLGRYFMNGGEFKHIRFATKKGHWANKAKDGLSDTAATTQQSYKSAWDHLKWMGPMIVFRVQGSAVHDESKAETAGTPNALDLTDMIQTFSGFNVEFYWRKDTQSTIYSANLHYQGQVSAALPTIATAANEQAIEMMQVQETQTRA